MAEDWLADVRKYAADADEKVVAAIVRHCGIALRTRDASLVSFADAKETGRVRDNFLKKKLALTDDDATLDSAIAAVGERMKADRTKNRVTVYYLLADHFDRLGLFGGTARGAALPLAATPEAVPVAAPAAASPAAAWVASEPPIGATPMSVARMPATGDGGGFIGFGLVAAAVVMGGALLAMVLGTLIGHGASPSAAPVMADPPADFSHPLPTMAPALPSAAAAPAAAPAGAGVIGAERDGKPMLTVYFDTGKADVTPDFAAVSQPVRDYLGTHPGSSAAISGFNDPTGNATLNAELSKNRAQHVQAALVAAGIDAGRTALVKPSDTTTTDMTPDQARRVEVTVTGG